MVGCSVVDGRVSQASHRDRLTSIEYWECDGSGFVNSACASRHRRRCGFTRGDLNISFNCRIRSGFVNRLNAHTLTCAAIQHGEAVPLGVVCNLDNLLLQLLEFKVQVTALLVVVGVVGGLNGQLTHALHHVSDFVGRALRGLNQCDGVTRIAHGLVQAAYLVRHSSGNGHTGGIVA